MRVIVALLAFLGPACALAQDTPVALNLDDRGVQLVPWTFAQASPPAAARFFGPWNAEPIELAGRLPAVCSVKLVEMPVPKDIHFTMKVVRPPKMDEKIFAEAPAPACP